MSKTDEELSQALLNIIQTNFPVESHPYEVLGNMLDISSSHAFDLVQELIRTGVVRRIGAIFDASHLGYKSALCAVAVTDPDSVDQVAQFISDNPHVTHNYERDDIYNIWFTMIEQSEHAIMAFLEEIGQKTGFTQTLYLPTLRLYKIKVDFDISSSDPASSKGSEYDSARNLGLSNKQGYVVPSEIVPESYSELDKAIIRELQENLSTYLEPYEHIARAVSQVTSREITQRVVLQRIRNWKFNGTIRRLGAALRHRKVGFSHNAMCIWDVPDEIVVQVGKELARFREVSHCYERPRREGWHANLFTMVHGKTEDACEEVVERMMMTLKDSGLDTSIERPRLLYSSREFKKISMRYFLEEK